MKFTETCIPGCYIVELARFSDDRGYFQESWNVDKLPIPRTEVSSIQQSNTSWSKKDVIRGLHIQRDRPQGKLVTCLVGEIRDVCLDLRPKSPTYGSWFGYNLRATVPTGLYLPPGTAHGFATLSREALVQYFCTETYDKESDGGIFYDDPELHIVWGVDNPIISLKDRHLPTLAEYKRLR